MLQSQAFTRPMPISTPDEAQLLEQAYQLDGRALGHIHDRFYPALYHFALYRIGDPTVAEDIAGEVFMRFLNALHTQKSAITSLRSWLFGVAAHLVADHFRNAKRRPPPVPLLENVPASDDAPAVAAERRMRRQAVQTALRDLTEEQQTVLALRFGDGYSLDETADALGKTTHAIKSLQARALGALRRVLVGEGKQV